MATNGITGKDAALYSDFAGLGQLKAQAKQDGQAALREVAQQFEQIFMNMMLQSMRASTESFGADNPFNSSEVEFFQGMLDQQLTLELSQNGGMGLADIIVRQLGGSDTSAETLRQALQLPADGDAVNERLNGGETLNQALLNLASRRVASSSLQTVNAISERLASADSAEGVDSADAVAEPPPAVDGGERLSFDSPEQFVAQLLPLAEQAARQLGVDPRVLVAQAALETGWGRSIIRRGDGSSSNNLFNIKAGSQWSGERVGVQTLEFRNGLPQPELAQFRAYDSLQQSFDDYVQLISSQPRYQAALQQADDPAAYLQALQEAGYASDPEYAEKIGRIFQGGALSGATLAALAGAAQDS